eukprot:8679252-Ditylum_brightwellii.AAC.1
MVESMLLSSAHYLISALSVTNTSHLTTLPDSTPSAVMNSTINRAHIQYHHNALQYNHSTTQPIHDTNVKWQDTPLLQ